MAGIRNHAAARRDPCGDTAVRPRHAPGGRGVELQGGERQRPAAEGDKANGNNDLRHYHVGISVAQDLSFCAAGVQ